MDLSLITVIVAVYNAEMYLERCVNSIINNTYKNLEIILVDDGSTDNSGEICDRYAEKDSRIKVIHKKNGGTAEARNTALKIAKGEYIAFADNDDFIHPDYYEILHSIAKSSHSDIVVCEITRDMPQKDFYEKKYNKNNFEIVDKKNFILGTYTDNWTRNTTPWNKLYKKELFDMVQFPVGKGFEDAYTTYKLIYNAEKIALTDAVLYYWYQNLESYSAAPSNAKKLLFREEAIRLQSCFYKGRDYKEIRNAAKKFYLKQLHFMHYQLCNVYEKNEDSIQCSKILRKKLFWNFYLNFHLLNREEFLDIFYYLHHFLCGVINKIKK